MLYLRLRAAGFLVVLTGLVVKGSAFEIVAGLWVFGSVGFPLVVCSIVVLGVVALGVVSLVVVALVVVALVVVTVLMVVKSTEVAVEAPFAEVDNS